MNEPAFPIRYCRKPNCERHANHRQGHQWLCQVHYRFGQMRATAKRRGKYVPSWSELEVFNCEIPVCADCHAVLSWSAASEKTYVATLQHYRAGYLGIVCRSCNTRHACMPGDSFREMPKDHKYCPHCKTAKPFSKYSEDNGRTGQLKLKSWCKQCSLEAHREWRKNKAA